MDQTGSLPAPGPGAPASLAAVLLQVLRRPGLWLSLWLLSLGLAVAGTLPVLLSLGMALSDRPLARALAQGEADAIFVELLTTSPALSPALLGGLAGTALLYWLAATLLSGGLVQALRRPGDQRWAPPGGGRVLQAAAASYAVMLRVGLLGLLLRAALLGLLSPAAVWLGLRLLGLSYARMLGSILGFAAVALLLWSAITVALHYARAHALGPEAGPPVPARVALWRGLRSAARAKGTTLVLAGTSAAALLALTVLGRALTHKLDVALWIGLAFAVRQAAVIGRTIIGLVVLGTAVEVVDSQQGG